MKFKNGDKVKYPTKKTVDFGYSNITYEQFIKQIPLNLNPYLTIISLIGNGKAANVCGKTPLGVGHANFYITDLELYEEGIIDYYEVLTDIPGKASKGKKAIRLHSRSESDKDFTWLYENTTVYLGCNPANFPNYFKPIYKPEEITLTLGSPNQTITIGREITAAGKIVSIEHLIQLREKMYSIISKIGWIVTVTEVKIGCSFFRLDDITRVIDTYKKINNE